MRLIALAAAGGLLLTHRLHGVVRTVTSPDTTRTVFPAGTVVPVRFLAHLVAGEDSAGAPVLAQTLAALVGHGCVVTPAFTEIRGRITRSHGGRWFGGRGRFGLTFDSIRVTRGGWVPMSGVLDSLEFARSGVVDSAGNIRGTRHTIAHRGAGVVPLAAVAATPAAVVPAALFASWALARKGARPVIMSGEAGVVRLTAPLSLGSDGPCHSAAADPILSTVPSLPRFVPHTDNGKGRPGDPVNLILLGSAEAIDSAFARAAWLVPLGHSARHTVKEVGAALLNRSEVRAPVSTQYFEGRPQDLAYERPSATVRVRHHARFWLLDSVTAIWVGAANEDIGLKLEPGKVSATHRISPAIDRERDLIVRELESTGCADLVAYDTLPGAQSQGRNAAGQRFLTDGRAAFVQAHRCPSN